MKKFLFLGVILVFAHSAKSQLYSYGIKGGISYSSYELSNRYVFYNTEGNSLSYHAGLFARRSVEKFFIQGEAIFTSGMKANISFRGNDLSFSKSSINIPLLIGRSFYPGRFRIYTGVSPGLYFGEDGIATYLSDHRLLPSGKSGTSPGIGYLAGTSVDFSGFSLDLRYERNFFGGFYYEDKNPNIRTYHRFSHIILGLAYSIQ